MTPADRAMRNAFDESVEQARSPLRMASITRTLPTTAPGFNLTSFYPEGGKLSIPFDQSLGTPTGSHYAVEEFRKPQQLPLLKTSPDIDYKRVRRKQSFSNLAGDPRDSDDWPLPRTSLSPLLGVTSPQSYFHPLPPPSPWTPHLRPGTYSPSLSSTIDTLPSTPPYTPTQTGGSSFDQWRSTERVGLSEPIRTKRKFPQLKAAKRLPHRTRQSCSGQEVWEVHAVVVDTGVVDVGERESTESEEGLHVKDVKEVKISRAVEKKGRSVRFAKTSRELETLIPSERSEGVVQEEDRSLTSNFSLSKFKFPAPPGHAWTGTFGHLDDLTPPISPASPATLHYKGASFDVVNPHASLLLGHPDFETPAEIDGLLDDYFNISSRTLHMAYDDRTGEKSSSQQSLETTHTSGSNGRQRVLYDNPESARRVIFNLRSASSHPTVGPMMPRGNKDEQLPYRAFSAGQLAGGVQLHPSIREALNEDRAASSGALTGGRGLGLQTDNFEPTPTTAGRRPQAGGGITTDLAQAIDRASSIYPRSQRSNPFDLTISEDGDDNIDATSSADRGSFHAAAEGQYDAEDDQAVYEDDTNAEAAQSTLEPETTIGNIFNYYAYPGCFDAAGASNATATAGPENTSSSVEAPRGNPYAPGRNNNPFWSPQSPMQPRRMVLDRLAGSASTPLPFGLPQSGLPPTPQFPPQVAAGSRYASNYSDILTTDQTYGHTGQLLQLTPSERTQWPFLRTTQDRAPDDHGPYGFSGSAVPTSNFGLSRAYHDDQENILPRSLREQPSFTSMDDTPTHPRTFSDLRSRSNMVQIRTHSTMLHSSSFYPNDDDSVWESTQASDSRPNLPEQRDAFDHSCAARPSEDGFADTSIYGSRNRLSISTSEPVPAIPPYPFQPFAGPPQVSTQVEDLVMPHLHPDGRTRVTDPDEEAAIRILADKIHDDGLLRRLSGMPRRSNTQSKADMKRIEEIRQNRHSIFPSVVDKVFKTVSARQNEQITPPQPVTAASQQSFVGAIKQRLGKKKGGDAYAEDVGLLGEHGELGFGDSAATIRSAPRATSPRPFPAAGLDMAPPHSLLTPPSLAVLRDRGNAAGSTFTSPGGEEIELQPLRRSRIANRAATSGQRVLRPLRLGGEAAESGRLTDAELVAAAPAWTSAPQIPLEELGHRSRTGGAGHITSFGIEQADGTVEHVSLLMHPAEARNLGLRRRQKALSKPWLRLCGLFPVSAAVFGLGGLDWKMRGMTAGAVTEMDPAAKRSALTVYLPLSAMFWALMSVMVALLLVALKS